MYEYRATVTSVYDGDTITFDVDLGVYTHVKKFRVRVAGIDAPEIYDPGPEGEDARDFLRRVLPVGTVVTLNTIKDKQEKYGRWLAYITTAEGVNVSALMVASGHAVAFMV